MPSLNDIVNVAESLEKSPMVLLQDSCVTVRNRNAKCSRCVDVCPHDCITVKDNYLSLRPLNCVNCGLCALVCPTEAIRPLKPTDIAAAHQLDSAWRANDGQAVVVCARKASKREADPSLFAEVPCMGHIHEDLLLAPLAEGATSVVLVDGNCATCKYGFVNDLVDKTVSTANALLSLQGAKPCVLRTHDVPERLLVEDATGMYGSSRRTFFSDTVKSAREMAVTAADSAIKQELGANDVTSIGERLRVSEEGTLPIIAVPRHDALVNALFAIGELAAEAASAASEAFEDAAVSSESALTATNGTRYIDTRLFASVEIDPLRCIQCGMCAVFCPTSALHRAPGTSIEQVEVLEFSTSDCVQCGLCVDVCWKQCISLQPAVSMDEVFSFDPKVIKLGAAARN